MLLTYMHWEQQGYHQIKSAACDNHVAETDKTCLVCKEKKKSEYREFFCFSVKKATFSMCIDA